MSPRPRPTQPVGLYDPQNEHDACGVAFVARLDGQPSRETVVRAIVALEHLEHRGAEGADPDTGDGAGILLGLPDAFFRGLYGAALPQPGRYGVGVLLLPHDRLQGHAHGPPAAGLLPGPPGPAGGERAGAGALALLDEHLPELGA